MSSSSFEAEARMAPLLAESFMVLAREQPEAYLRMCASLEQLSVLIGVDDERFAAEFFPQRAWVRAARERESAEVTTRRGTILDVLDNRSALTEAVLADAIRVKGSLETLLRLHAGLVLYVQGAARCPGFLPLLRRLRAPSS